MADGSARRALLTGPSRRGDVWVAAFARRGFLARHAPVLRFDAIVDDSVEAACRSLADGRYVRVVLASAVAAEFLALAYARHATGAVPADGLVVGDATAAAVRSKGLFAPGRTVDVADPPDAHGVARALGKVSDDGGRTLVVRPSGRSRVVEVLAAAGAADVDAVALYRTEPTRDVPTVAADLASGSFDLAVFASPSAVAAVFDSAAGEAARAAVAGSDPGAVRTRLVAIGGTTAAAMRDRELFPHAIAARPDPDAAAEAAAALWYHPALPERRSARDTVSGANDEVAVSSQTPEPSPKRTPLYDAHVRAGGRMVPFAGWEMPVQYSGIVAEHRAVRERAGLFDVSHMGEVAVRGPEALDFLQRVTCNNVAKLAPGRAHYTGLMLAEGGFVDDLLIYRRGDDDFLLVVNAANRDKDVRYLEEHRDGADVEIADVSEAWAQLAIQGPRAEAILGGLLPGTLEGIRYYGFVETDVCGAPSIVSRTGYTGEDGFEIYAPADAGPAIWAALLAEGGDEGLVPAGLGARDTLRLEARMALYGNDIDDRTTPYEAGLGWIVKLKKGEFIGRDVLARQKAEGVRRTLVGFEIAERAIARHGYPVSHDGASVGRVTSGTFAPYLEKNIGLAYVPTELGEPGTTFEIAIRNRTVAATVVPTPFYTRDA